MEAMRRQQEAFEELQSNDDSSDDDEGDYAECPICKESLEDKETMTCHPTLDIPHTFCKECLKKHLQEKGENECPLCRKRCLSDTMYNATYRRRGRTYGYRPLTEEQIQQINRDNRDFFREALREITTLTEEEILTIAGQG